LHIHFSGTVDGSEEDINSYRAELSGIMAAVEYTNTICNKYGISSGICTIYCDNKGALMASFGHKRPTPRWSSYDLVRRIRSAVATSPIQWKHYHVKGHQDSTGDFRALPYRAKGNVLADYFATKAYNDHPTGTQNQPVPKWTLTVNDTPISGNIQRRMKTEIFKPIMTHRWATIFQIREDQRNTCDWGTFFKNIESQSDRECHWNTKYYARLLPVGTNLKRRRHSTTAACPCCGEEEDHDHIIQCRHIQMDTTFDELYDEITDYVDQHANHDVAHGICFLLKHFRSPAELPSDLETTSPHIHNQLDLGQGAFFAGLWIHQWLQLQELYHVEHGIKRHAQKWIIHLMHRIQQIPKAMWMTRNQILHKTTDLVTLNQKHEELNTIIQEIYERKPHQRMMAHCDNLYFSKYDRAKLTNLKLQKKTNWIAGANLILNKYERSTTLQSERFTSYFQWDNG
jgi:hypothetical protein